MDIVPVYALFMVAALGYLSCLWRNLCLATLISASIYILAHSAVLPPDMTWPFDIKYLGYFGALMSGASAAIVALMSAQPTINDNPQNTNYMMGCAIAVSLLFVIQGVMGFTTQLYFNLGVNSDHWSSIIFFPVMFVVTGLQLALISKGGWDGTNNIYRSIKASIVSSSCEIYSQRHTNHKTNRQDSNNP